MVTRTEFYISVLIICIVIFFSTVYVPTPTLPVAETTLERLDTSLTTFVEQIAENHEKILTNKGDITQIKDKLELIQKTLSEVNRKLKDS